MADDEVTFNDLVDAMLSRTRERNPTFRFTSAYDVYPHLKVHAEDAWRAYRASDSQSFKDAMLRLAAETQRAAEDLDLDLDGRYREMVKIQAAKWRGLVAIASIRDLYARVEIQLDLLKLTMFQEVADRASGESRRDPLAAASKVRPLDHYIGLYLTAWLGCEAVGLTPKPTPAA